MVGKEIEVFWEDTDDGDQWIPANVVEYDSTNRMHLVLYEDGDEDWYDLQGVNYRLTSANIDHEGNMQISMADIN